MPDKLSICSPKRPVSVSLAARGARRFFPNRGRHRVAGLGAVELGEGTAEKAASWKKPWIATSSSCGWPIISTNARRDWSEAASALAALARHSLLGRRAGADRRPAPHGDRSPGGSARAAEPRRRFACALVRGHVTGDSSICRRLWPPAWGLPALVSRSGSPAACLGSASGRSACSI